MDDTPPTLTCVESFSATLEGGSVTIDEADLVVALSDNCAAGASVVSPAFPIHISAAGIQPITLIAMDQQGNTASCALQLIIAEEPSAALWTWMKGSNQSSQGGSYGTIGVVDPSATPSARQQASAWADSEGHLWLFGGWGVDSQQENGRMNDLWRYDVAANAWCWITGSSVGNQSGIYGVMGVAGDANTPGGRRAASAWFDPSGRLWLFGGIGYDQNGLYSHLSDLWSYEISTGLWTWINGSSTGNAAPVYCGGGPACNPGPRMHAVSWMGLDGKLWLFGGLGESQHRNDLWCYDPMTGEWALVKGTSEQNQSGVYGTQGQGSPETIPGAREAPAGWVDAEGNLWLFGGTGYVQGVYSHLNDLWRFDLTASEWTWMGGADHGGDFGEGQLGVPDVSAVPSSRSASSFWRADDGSFWLYGGFGWDVTGTVQMRLSDVWRFEPETRAWTWVDGPRTGDEPVSWGEVGVPSPSNTPGQRRYAAAWPGVAGTYWIFGGDVYGYSYNDLWRYGTSLSEFALSYTAGPNGSIDGPSSQVVVQGTDGETVTAVPDLCYEFIEWSDGSTENPRTDFDVQVDIDVTAYFADVEPPLLSCAATFEATLDGGSATVLEADVVLSLSDNCAAGASIVSPAFPLLFTAPGTETVVVVAQDAEGNTASCSVDVMIVPAVRCELVLEDMGNWTWRTGYTLDDFSVIPNNPVSVYSSPPRPPRTTVPFVGGYTTPGTEAIDLSVDGQAPGTVTVSPGLQLLNSQIGSLDSYGPGDTVSLVGAPSLANALLGTQVEQDRVYMARATVANAWQRLSLGAPPGSQKGPGRLPTLRFRLGETSLAGLGLAIDQITDLSANHIVEETEREHRVYFHAMASGRGEDHGTQYADRNLTFGVDVIDILGGLLTDDVTFELRKVEMLSFDLADLGPGTVVLNQGGEVDVDFALAAGTPPPPPSPDPFGPEWVFSSLIDSYPLIAPQRVATGNRGAGDRALSLQYAAGAGNTVAGWDTRLTYDLGQPEIVNGVPNDSIVVAEFYLSASHDPLAARPAETRVMMSDTVTEGRSAEFRFRAATGDVADGQSVGDTGLAPGAITGLEGAAKRYVVVIEPQSQASAEVGLRLGAFVNLFDSFAFPDLSTDPPGVFQIGGQPFVYSAMSNGDMTIHRVVVTVYPRPDALLGEECP